MKKIRIICLLLCLAIVLSSCSLLNHSSQDDNSKKWTEDSSERSSRNKQDDDEDEEEESNRHSSGHRSEQESSSAAQDSQGESQKPAEENQESSYEEAAKEDNALVVGFITDYGSNNDMAYNQTGYEACKSFCDRVGWDLLPYMPYSDSDEARIDKIKEAIDDGCQVIVTSSYIFGYSLPIVVELYPDITFIAMDVGYGDLPEGYSIPKNLVCVRYQVELSGFMAGYAAVKLGYKKLGFLGGMAVPEVVRYGYGFVQGAEAAAKELGLMDVELKYMYANQFYGDEDVFAEMTEWYENGTQVVFVCGGGLFVSVAEAAYHFDGKVIGIDYDQQQIIDGMYGQGYTLTSAIKGFEPTVRIMLNAVMEGTFSAFGGKEIELGISPDPEDTCVGLAPSTLYSDSFTKEDYTKLLRALYDGKYTVSGDWTKAATDFATVITVIDLGYLK